MKHIFASALTAFTVLAAGQAFAKSPAFNEVFYNAKFQMSEITVVKDGQTVTYDVPAQLADKASFTSEGEDISFGLVHSRCSPYIGDTVAEMKIPVAEVSGVQTSKTSSEESPSITSHLKLAKTGIVTVPAGSKVYGTCGAGSKTLSELSIYAKEKTSITYESN